MRQGEPWKSRKGGGGQVIVEVMLILPVFMMVVFTIMEIGHLAFMTIMIHHAAYEVARIGSLTTGPPGPCHPGVQPQPNQQNMQKIAAEFLGPLAKVDTPGMDPYIQDPQSTCTPYDLVVTVRENVPLVFPLTGLFVGKPLSLATRSREISATVRMPVEQPLFK